MELSELLDIAKEKTGSDNATANAIGITRAVIYAWRRGEREPTNKQCADIAELIGVHWSVLVRASEIAAAHRRGEPEQAARWERRSVMGSWGAVILAMLIGIAPETANAAQLQSVTPEMPLYTLCRIKRLARRALKALGFPRGFAPHPV